MKTKQNYMKTKSIILSGLLLATLGAATTSCEDMLNVEDELHTKNLAPQDTVYQVMGILNRMQSLVDRTVVLGELRADLVDLNEAVASTSLQEVMANNISTDNEYNSIADYYSVINSCNVYLAYVDSNYVEHNKKKYEKEIQVVKTYRAWTYLELAKTYGNVPFVTDPVLTSVDADKIVESTTNRADMEAICTYFINDLLPYVQTYAPITVPNYGNSNINGYKPQTFFIPTRLMVAELYLWRGSFTHNQSDFVSACQYYYDYINTVNNVATTGVGRVKWGDNNFRRSSDDYTNVFTSLQDTITVIPMDTCAYDGTWSQLYAMFNSQYENNYYVSIVPSQRIREISGEQINCVYSNINNKRDTVYSTSKLEWEDSLQRGDLRLNSVYHRSAVSNMYTAQYSQDRQHIMKYATSTNDYGADQKLKFYRVYRKGIVWLHFAEALNRAGFPQTAFAILKYGLTNETMSNYVSDPERSYLSNVPSYINGSIDSWSTIYFRTSNSSNVSSDNPANTLGIHSRGSGDSEYNKYYALSRDEQIWDPVDALAAFTDSVNAIRQELMKKGTLREDKRLEFQVSDTIYSVTWYDFESSEDSLAYDTICKQYFPSSYAYYNLERAAYNACREGWMEEVQQLILDEEALEGMFEGSRFYDLMRYAMYNQDPDYIYKQVARRKGSDTTDSRAEALRGGNWYLPLPKR